METNKTHEDVVIPTVGIVLFKQGSVLLVRHEEGADHFTGMYGLPSGRINENETERQAAARELLEETGLRTDENALAEIPRMWQATIERKDGRKTFSWKLFAASSYQGDLMKNEETTPEWISIESTENLTLLPNVGEAIQEGLKVLKENK